MSIQNGAVRSHQVRRSLIRLAWVLTLCISIPLAAMRLAGGSDTADTAKNSTGAKAQQSPSPDSSAREETMPVAINLPSPVFPDSAIKAGLEGAVRIQVLVDTAGNVADAKIKTTSGYPFLDRAALEAARKGKWVPAIQDGQKVAVWVSYFIKFGEWKPHSPDEKGKN